MHNYSIGLRRFILGGVLLMLFAHLLSLILSGQSAASTPISQLSRGDSALVHTAGLAVLAAVQLALAVLLWRAGSGSRLWSAGCALMVLNAPILIYVAYYFASAPDAQLFGPDANDPLAILASNVGVIMGLLQLELRRSAPRCAQINGALFVLWIALIPVIPFIESHWLGTYERVVGATLLGWCAMLALLAPGSGKTRA